MSDTVPAPTVAPNHKARGHHPYGPSSLGSLERSPCFKSRSGDNEASRLGTAQHEAVESGLISEELSDEKADAVARAIRMTEQLVAMLKANGKTPHVFRELYLRVDDEPTEGWAGTTGGFPDWVCLYETGTPGEWYAYVLDWKFGAYAVTEAKQNRQGQSYLLGVDHVLASGEFPGIRGRVVAGTVVFFSPHRDEEPSQHEFTRGEFEKLLQDISGIVITAQIARTAIAERGIENATEYLHPSTSTCAFCERLGDCPAVRALAERIRAKYKPLEVPADISGVDISDPVATAEGLKLASTVATWAKAYRQRVTSLAFENPDKVPAGYRLTASNPVRVVKPLELYRTLVDKFGEEIVHEHVELPLTPFGKRVRDGAPRGEKDAAEERFRADLQSAGLIEPSPTPTVSLRMK